ncbi:MAG: hypothetical protein NZ517_03595 [Candidatus Nitrosocaldus sp.]|nr:hypothetical protein [Candidatus Nitrosocaldus sp.]
MMSSDSMENSNNSDSSYSPSDMDASNMQVEEVQLSQQTDSSTIATEGITMPQQAVDESMIQQMVDEKIASITSSVGEAVQKASDAINTVNAVKTDIENLKKSMKDLTEAFETTLVDFKAFQAEIANPLNFMRKYFDQLNIDALSDPTLPLQKSDINFGNNNGNGDHKSTDSDIKSNADHDDEPLGTRKEGDVVTVRSENGDMAATSIVSNGENDAQGTSTVSKNIISLAQSNGITLARLMELILTIGEFMKTFGNEYANILHVQCKLLNLSNEAEKIVYSVVDMLSKSTLTPEECAVSLYMLADVLGFKDKDADTLYARLRMSIKSHQFDSSKSVDSHG